MYRASSLREQKQEVMALKMARRHQYILQETAKIKQVSRHDHQVMVCMLLAEACRHDQGGRQNSERWRSLVRRVRSECRSHNSLLRVTNDPYDALIAQLSSMMLWSEPHREWNLRYCEEKVAERQARQGQLLWELKNRGSLFL